MVYQQPHATLDPSQKIGAGLRELISYHRLTKNRQETEKRSAALWLSSAALLVILLI